MDENLLLGKTPDEQRMRVGFEQALKVAREVLDDRGRIYYVNDQVQIIPTDE